MFGKSDTGSLLWHRGRWFFSNKWLGKVEPSIEDLPTWSLMKYKRFQEEVCDWNQFQDLLKQLDAISKKLDFSIAQLASLYIK